MSKRRLRKVSMRELHEIWSDLQARGVWYNGCTIVELRRLYGGANIRHKPGVGWFKRGERITD